MPSYKDNSKGTWYCKFYYVDWTGEKKQKLKRGFKLKREADQWERSFLEHYAKDPNITFQTLYDKYKEYLRSRSKPSTYSSFTKVAEVHIVPYFKNLNLSEITPAVILQWQNHILDQGFSAGYSRKLNANLKTIFNYAVKFMDLRTNPVKTQICKPKRSNIDYWTPEEYSAVSELMKDNIAIYTAFEVLYYTGIRKGELMALTWNDIDVESKTISITKTMAYVDKKYFPQDPKTEKSNRVISVPDFLIDELMEYKSKLYSPEPDHLIFPYSKEWALQALKRYAKKAGIKQIRVHDLRHSHASVLINLGANPLMIADRLGHDNVSITMNTYSHLFKSHEDEIINKLNSIKK